MKFKGLTASLLVSLGSVMPAMAQNQIYQHRFQDKAKPMVHHHVTMICGDIDDCTPFVFTMDCANMVGINQGIKQPIGAGSKAARECYQTYMIQPGTNQ